MFENTFSVQTDLDKFSNEDIEKDQSLKKIDFSNINYHVESNDDKFSDEQPIQKESSKENTKVKINVFDIASYILLKLGKMTTMRLQKLVYYCQAWSLVWDEKPLFSERIEAWSNGPVIPKLFFQHKGLFFIEQSDLGLGNPNKLSEQQKDSINAVLKYYGKKNSQWLIELSHMEEPWKQARRGIPEGLNCNREIKLIDMANYYSSL